MKNLFSAVKVTSFALVIGLGIHGAIGQDITNNKFGKGLRVMAKDSSFFMKFGTRIQYRYDGSYIKGADPEYSDKLYLRRARFKFDGYAFSPKLVYKLEYDIVTPSWLDACVKWNFAGNFHLWFGQTKLAGNRERVLSLIHI